MAAVGRRGAAWREHLLVVVADDGEVRGYAESSVYRDGRRTTTRGRCRCTSASTPRQQGYGRRLYDELLGCCVPTASTWRVAAIALPNPASEALHRACGLHPSAACAKRSAGSSARGSTSAYWLLRLGEETPAS
jgi:phosphinothricin acetyltransferase